MTIKNRSDETLREWLMGQLVKPVDACLWCGSYNWYKKKGISWFCGSCDPEDKLLTWPERLELIRRLRANRDNLEELNAIPDTHTLNSVTWSAIKRIAYPHIVEDPPSNDSPPVGFRGREDEDDTIEDVGRSISEGTDGTAQPCTTDERLDIHEGQGECQKEPTSFLGVKSQKEKLRRLRTLLRSYTTEEKPGIGSGS